MMNKNFFAVIVLSILSTPFVVLSIISIMQIKPEVPPLEVQQKFSENVPQLISENVPQITTETPKQLPSKIFMNGYRDGWHGVWVGPIRWTVSDDYRQGHMLGSYDRKNKISRYPPSE